MKNKIQLHGIVMVLAVVAIIVAAMFFANRQSNFLRQLHIPTEGTGSIFPVNDILCDVSEISTFMLGNGTIYQYDRL